MAHGVVCPTDETSDVALTKVLPQAFDCQILKEEYP